MTSTIVTTGKFADGRYAERGSLMARGRTVAEAKAALDRKVDAALSGSYDPFVVSSGGWTAIGWRTPEGWCYRIQSGPDRAAPQGIDRPGGCTICGPDRRDAEQQAARHVFTLGCDVQTVRADGDIPPWIEGRADRIGILSWCRWQRAAAHAQANAAALGIDPHAQFGPSSVHGWACANEDDPRFA